jgi:hypothetical protein
MCVTQAGSRLTRTRLEMPARGNTQSYYEHLCIMAVKSFTTLGPGAYPIKTFCGCNIRILEIS